MDNWQASRWTFRTNYCLHYKCSFSDCCPKPVADILWSDHL